MREHDAAALAFRDEIGASGPVAVAGNLTRWDHGGVVEPDARVVRAPQGIVDYDPAEMTVRVRAGTTVAELHGALAAAGQRTALPERGGTVGGALAVGQNDMHVLGRGRVREFILEVRYVSSQGRIIVGGGPTVKNVTGFDLPRLMVGALGTLGFIAEAVIRTRPIPTTSRWYAARQADPFVVLDSLHRPSSVLWDGTRTWVQLEGHTRDVGAQAFVLSRLAAFEPVDGPPALPPHRWSLSPSSLRRLDEFSLGSFVALIGVGTVHASLPPPPRTLTRAALALHARLKAAFDPDIRLNPGRYPGGGS